MSALPRPKPKPKPKMKTAAPSAPASNDSSTASTSTTSPGDSDFYDMFNRNRSEERRLRAQRAEEEAKRAAAVTEISDDDSELPGSPDGKRKRGQSGVRIRGPAEWTLKNPRGRSPQRGRRGSSTVVASDSDSDTNKGSSDSEARPLGEDDDRKGKKRAKSRSPTPPPPLSQVHRKAILTIVREHLETAPAGILADADSLETNSKPPAKSARKFKDQITPEAGSTDSVTIQVRWEPHPYDENAASLPPELFEFQQHRDQTLRQVFLQLTEKKHLFLQDLVVMKDGQPITQAITPRKLVDYSASLQLSACEENAYQVMQLERNAEAAAKVMAEPDIPETTTGAFADATELEDDARRLLVSIRSAAHPQAVTFRVKATITCAGLLKRYLKDRGISAKPKTRLQLDGEDLEGDKTLALALEDADFDDDEEDVQLDVAGL